MTTRSQLVKAPVASAVRLLSCSGLSRTQSQQQDKQATPALGQAAVVGSYAHPAISSFGRGDAPQGHPLGLEIGQTKESS
jgi:hypothetical protein